MNKKILLIDDDSLVLKSLVSLLRSKSYEVVGCASGREAIEQFTNERFNIVVSDIRLPGQDGIETIKKIRALELNQEIPVTPVILITGYASEEKPIEAIKLGVRDYILKPFDNEQLLRSIENCLHSSEDLDSSKDVFLKCRTYSRASELKSLGCFPYFKEVESVCGNRVFMSGKLKIMLGGNNYLGAANDPDLRLAFQEAVNKYGVGSGGSRLVSGNSILYKKLECKIYEFFKREDALIFNTGYQANLGSISCLVARHDYVLLDSNAHASLVDGARLSFGVVKRFNHNDLNDFERIICGLPKGRVLVVVDGVYSMEGDLPPLRDVALLCKKYDARLLVDEAHAFGVFGKSGRGITELFNLDNEVDLITATFSKSCGALGGFITGKKEVIDFIRYNARSALFSTAIPAAILAAAEAGFDKYILKGEQQRKKLWQNTDELTSGLKEMGLNLGNTSSPIIPIILGDVNTTLSCWKALYDRNVFVGAMITPAVPPNQCLLRLSCSADLQSDEIKYVLDQCREVFEANSVFKK